MSQLRSLLDELAAADPAGLDVEALTGEELRDGLPAVQAAINRLTALQTRMVAAGEAQQVHAVDGMRSMKSWLTGHCRLSGVASDALVRAGRRLRRLPELAAAYDDGDVTPAHVAEVTKGVTPARMARAAGIGVDHGETDRLLAEAARRLGPEDTAQVVRRWVIGVDPDGTLDDDAGRPRVFRIASSSGGRHHLSGHLDAAGAETVHTVLESIMGGDRPAGDTRTHAERQGDALVELARQALIGGNLPAVRGERAQVRVTIDWQSLCAATGALGIAGGRLAFAGPITPETARRLACDASVVRVITGPDGLPLDVGRARRTASEAIRRAVELRDGHCVFAGCSAPPAWCDVHHVVHWAHGGPTSCDNGALVCEAHHTAVHEGGFSLRRNPGTAVWHTYRPDGSEVLPRGPTPLRL
ncbi:HNH endonuclease [Geodermatophilus sp. YIM 151500]|uniref:HNH endonuclease signature motif containing protein n=1 Tax=Geodermatophilus sp. YIM 151500 TaxID=2984531 RepID=UPI0021E3D5FB|nr:HNH endonuclease signature motif containing protein [Geodermatophilus sp. YIM 151500]MCV2491224.1 HNH endonuclease [Geodermatophilus sp. YIM 151500]